VPAEDISDIKYWCS